MVFLRRMGSSESEEEEESEEGVVSLIFEVGKKSELSRGSSSARLWRVEPIEGQGEPLV